MPLRAPFNLGPFVVDAEGRLSPARSDVPAGFSIRWRGRVVHAHLLQSDPLDGRLHIWASLGRIRSTALDPSTRQACFAVLRNLLGCMPDSWTAHLLPDHQPKLEVETTVSLPITVTNLVTELALFSLMLTPYLDILDDAGVELVAGARTSVVVKPLVRTAENA